MKRTYYLLKTAAGAIVLLPLILSIVGVLPKISIPVFILLAIIGLSVSVIADIIKKKLP